MTEPLKDKNETSQVEIEDYSEASFWNKCLNYSKSIGYDSMDKIFQLYYALESDKCSTKHKSIIYGALAYVVSPIDAIPDLTPILGYTDDMGVVVAALCAVANCIDEKVKEKSKNKLINLFG